MLEKVRSVVARQARADNVPKARWRRTLLTSVAAASLGVHDVAWAVCSNGKNFRKMASSSAPDRRRTWTTGRQLFLLAPRDRDRFPTFQPMRTIIPEAAHEGRS